MKDKKILKNVFIVGFLVLALVGQVSQALARWDDRRDDRRGHHDRFFVHHPYPRYGRTLLVLPGDFLSLSLGGFRYYYYDGVYYRRYADEYVVVPAPIGAVITTLPPGCELVVINGVSYYVDNGIYYRRSRYGYEVVSEPRRVVVANAAYGTGYPVQAVSGSGEKVGLSDVIVLSRSGVSDDVIIDKILRTGARFNLSAEEVGALQKEGVSSRVINFMLGSGK